MTPFYIAWGETVGMLKQSPSSQPQTFKAGLNKGFAFLWISVLYLLDEVPGVDSQVWRQIEFAL